MRDKIIWALIGVGFLAMFFGLGSIENPDYSINWYGVAVASVGGVLVFITTLYQEWRNK